MAALFGRFDRVVVANGLERHCPVPIGKSRWLTGAKDAQDALTHGKICQFEVIPHASFFVVAEVNGDIYACLPRWVDISDSPTESSDLLTPIQNAGLSSIVWMDERSPIVAPVEQVIESVYGHDKEFEPHEIEHLFRRHSWYQLDPAARAWRGSRLESELLSFVARSKIEKEPQAWTTDNVLVELRTLLEGRARLFVGDQLLGAVSTGNARHAFLELFRALESLRFVSMIDELSAVVEPSSTFWTTRWESIDVLQRTLGWRPRIDESIDSVISRLSEPEIRAALTKLGAYTEGAGAKALSAELYRHRNAIAHGSLKRPHVAADGHIDVIVSVLRRLFLKDWPCDEWAHDLGWWKRKSSA